MERSNAASNRRGNPKRNKGSRRTLLIRATGTLLAVILLLYLLSQQGWSEIQSALHLIAWRDSSFLWRLALAMGLMILSRLAVSARWHVLLRSANLKISVSQSLGLTFAGLFANNFLPTTVGGDLIRLAGALLLKFDAAIITASLIADRLVGMAGMAMTLPVGLVRFWHHPSSDSPRSLTQLFSLAGVLLSIENVVPRWFRGAWKKSSILVRQLFTTLALWFRKPGALLLALVFTWIHMLCFFLILTLLFDGMDDHLSFWLIGGLYSLVYFITLLPISINGYGVQELSMTFIFSSLGGAAVASGFAAALLFRTLLMIASLPGAVFVPGILAGRKDQVADLNADNVE